MTQTIEPLRKSKSQVIRQRITPTFVHSHIFANEDLQKAHTVRYTATFASSVFDCHGYEIKTIHSRPKKIVNQPPTKPSTTVPELAQLKDSQPTHIDPCNYYQGRTHHRE